MLYEKLMKKERPCPFEGRDEVIYENKTAYLTYALAPYSKDHMLIVPKRHISSILELRPAEIKDIDRLILIGVCTAHRLGHRSASVLVREGEARNRSVEHLHYHVIPEHRIGDLDINAEKRTILTPGQVSKVKRRIKSMCKIEVKEHHH